MQAKEIYEVLVIDADISLVYEDNRSDFVRDIYIYIYIYIYRVGQKKVRQFDSP